MYKKEIQKHNYINLILHA